MLLLYEFTSQALMGTEALHQCTSPMHSLSTMWTMLTAQHSVDSRPNNRVRNTNSSHNSSMSPLCMRTLCGASSWGCKGMHMHSPSHADLLVYKVARHPKLWMYGSRGEIEVMSKAMPIQHWWSLNQILFAVAAQHWSHPPPFRCTTAHCMTFRLLGCTP